MEFSFVLSIAGVLRTHVPFFTEALSTIPIIEDSRTALAATDGTVITFNCEGYDRIKEQWGDKWFETDQLAVAFLLLHELDHIIFNHCQRKLDRDDSRWNDAADYVVHDQILPLFKHKPFNLTGDRLTRFINTVCEIFYCDPKYHGLTVEEVYTMLPAKRGTNTMPDLKSGPVPYPEDVRNLITNSLQGYGNRNAGKLPGGGAGHREFQQAEVDPPVSMKSVLACIRDLVNSSFWDYRYPGKDDMWRTDGGRMPTPRPVRGDLVKELVFVVDSSGSMTDAELSSAAALAKASFAHVRRRIRVLSVNTEVVDKGELSEDMQFEIKETGGTHLACMMDWFKTNRVNPSVIVLVTDVEVGTR